ncbi:hypothetical protein [Haloferula sp. BvORR071]|uniref:hypothetical protein n=1 Tax=Haloferula sp. BvORR071 TaxID=1396141 RepID=UPI0005573379|nr:hypothetical protein [Haloferula sp. BvORR071]
MNAQSSSATRRVLKRSALILTPILLFAGWFLLGQPGFGGVLAYAKASDNTDCIVTQTCNGSWGEPYSVGFYSRAPGGIWNWQYIDHEADHWCSCRMEIDVAKNEVKIFNGEHFERSVQLHADDRRPEQKPPHLPPALSGQLVLSLQQKP